MFKYHGDLISSFQENDTSLQGGPNDRYKWSYGAPIPIHRLNINGFLGLFHPTSRGYNSMYLW